MRRCDAVEFELRRQQLMPLCTTADERPRADNLSPLAMTRWGGARRTCAPLGAAGGVRRSIVGSPWLCQGLRCLRMTGVVVDSWLQCAFLLGVPFGFVRLADTWGSFDCAQDDSVWRGWGWLHKVAPCGDWIEMRVVVSWLKPCPDTNRAFPAGP